MSSYTTMSSPRSSRILAIWPSALSNLVAAIPESLASDEDDDSSLRCPSAAVVDDEGDDAGGAVRRAVSTATAAVAAFPTDSILAVIIV